ncbi:MAG: cob(I)yrinic acid a,c-diamide adenosyltransferase, partial [Mangrovimonas sp.]|nr:cob(I)yrinic acid a,c-diamide adenosyltransferase [Mangrovimonas sp.]
GLLRDQEIEAHYKTVLETIQNNLFTVGAILATDPEKAVLKIGKERLDIERLEPSDVTLLEEEIDTMNEALPPMTHFVLPGGHQTVSFCHITRCVCRRAERLATALHDISPIDSLVLIYLNRLSDYFFVLARKLTLDLRANEVAWIPKKKS